MLVLIVIAAVVIVAAVVFLAMGRGGGMSVERNDYFPLDLGPVSATDVALLRPPTGVWGYNMQATNEAMELIAESIRERDVRIVALEQLVTDLSRDHAPLPVLGSPYPGARHRRIGSGGNEPGPASQEITATAPTAADVVPWASPTVATAEPGRLPFDPPRPGGDMPSAPPEESHD